MTKDLIIRDAVDADVPRLLEIYAPYVLNTAITFEYAIPSAEEFSNRIRSIQTRYPFLVAELGGVVTGYAYAGYFKPRAAYDWSVEVSIYVDQNLHHAGIGGKLYQALERTLAAMQVQNLNACITYIKEEDPYLTHNSPRFHAHLGYENCAHFHKCGYKFGRWYDMIWMEKWIGLHPEDPGPFIPYPKLSQVTAVTP